MKKLNAEKQRLAEGADKKWKLWGPYLSERQWGTVREDYSATGEAWKYFPHDHARSRAYRWGEDGIGGFSDKAARLCLSFAFWNGQDSILKERLFGLTNTEGNHGEDVKEIYYYLDATPTHSYLKMLYKYPQSAFPYEKLLAENQCGKDQREFELIDTGIFNDDRYFDVFIEYAKAGAEDVLALVTVHNRGPEESTVHILPQLCFRNTWSWSKNPPPKPELFTRKDAISAKHHDLGDYKFYYDGKPELLFTENDTNTNRFYQSGAEGFFKDAFHDYLIGGNKSAVNPVKKGTKAAAHYMLSVPANGSATIRLRLVKGEISQPFQKFDSLFETARDEANEFYGDLQEDFTNDDARLVQRQAFAGMIWNKQIYHYNVFKWLKGDSNQPVPPEERWSGRNSNWQHFDSDEILSMPDKWEYPWFAAWDLAFHCIPFALIDPEFAKSQLILFTREWYMHPNGQLPAYEWAFDDVNPPVHAWAAWRVFQMDRKNHGGDGDHAFLERVFHKLMLNFTWWVNRKDADGRNIFQGGFLGLDNIGVFDRSKPLPTGGYINQADGTSWMAMYSLNLMRIALELATKNKAYEDIASKFFEHFLNITAAMNNMGDEGIGLWDEEDEFYYDVLNLPDGQMKTLKIRSMVGLIPLFAVETLEPDLLDKLPDFKARLQCILKKRPDLAKLVSRWEEQGIGQRTLLSLLRGHRMKCLLRRALDETEFLSDYGIRSLSRYHQDQPYEFDCNDVHLTVKYQPAESKTGVFGGNSNWRGPLWMPMNFLIIESLQKFHHYYGSDFKIECPTGSGNFMTINDVACEITHRLTRLFLKNDQGQRPVFNHYEKMQNDPHFRDNLFFYEYFDGDDGHGLGASHQTGWTGLIAKLLQPRVCEE